MDNVEVVVVAPTPARVPGPVLDFEVDCGVGLVAYGGIRGTACAPLAPSRDAVTLSLSDCLYGGDDCSLTTDADRQ